MGGTLLQKQRKEWVVIGYHSKRLPQLAKNFGITELELAGLLVNIHGFIQLLHNRYFEVLVDHKAIKYMIKSKTESATTRLKTLLLKLSGSTPPYGKSWFRHWLSLYTHRMPWIWFPKVLAETDLYFVTSKPFENGSRACQIIIHVNFDLTLPHGLTQTLWFICS